jgi:hypothetical protein
MPGVRGAVALGKLLLRIVEREIHHRYQPILSARM